MSRRFEDDSPRVPFPTVPVSSGEWMPHEITPHQVRAHEAIADAMDAGAKRHGMTRQQFLRTAAATTTAFMVLNKIGGTDTWGDNAVYPLKQEHCDDLDAAHELLDTDEFIIDVQTHHIDLTPPIDLPPNLIAPIVTQFCQSLRFVDSGDLKCPEVTGRMNFIKEMFLDSQTNMAVISGLPEQLQFPTFTVPPGLPLTPPSMAGTRDLVNQLASSTRCLTQAMIDPKTPPGSPTSTDSLEHQVRDLGAKAIKCYTYNGSWRLDDEDVGYPIWRKAIELGIGLVNVHKGLPLKAFGVNKSEDVRTIDFPKVVADFPKLKFCAYHSGFFGAGDHPEGLDAGFTPKNGKQIPGRYGNMEFLQQVKKIPRRLRKNVYTEIGSTFAILSSNPDPTQVAHFMGQILKTFGSHNILWGTDCIWWGSPQFLIDRFKLLQIPAKLQEKYGYPALTKQAKAQIFGLNAARLYGVDPRECRYKIPADALAMAQQEKGGFRAGRSLKLYGAQSRRQFLAMFGRHIREHV